jgi:hypothetical protein
MFESKNQKKRNRTLGFLLRELHKRIDLDDRFDETLCQFLEMRNTFVHNLDEIPGWSIHTEEGMVVARTFLSEFLRVTEIVLSVFWGLVSSWAEDNDMNFKEMNIAGIDHPFFVKVDEIYKPLVTSIFFLKDDRIESP